MKYHQSEKSNNDHRVSALKKVQDKFNYSNMKFPASLQDIRQFELQNQICINIYQLDENDSIIKLQGGCICYYD
jgi:hypothetical protein